MVEAPIVYVHVLSHQTPNHNMHLQDEDLDLISDYYIQWSLSMYCCCLWTICI